MTEQTHEDIIFGKNAVAEFLKNDGKADTVLLALDDAQAGYYTALAKQCGAVVKRVHPKKLDALCGCERHQGVAATVRLVAYTSIDQLLAVAEQKGQPPFLILSDGVADPHNLGAILRTAECCGVHGVVIPERGGCPITPAVMSASVGAAAAVPVVRAGNLANAVRTLKKRNIFVYCADMDGAYCCDTDLTGPIALVVGSEGFGVSPLIKKLCDGVVSLPMAGKINSLNASVAAGVLMYEIVRQRINQSGGRNGQ